MEQQITVSASALATVTDAVRGGIGADRKFVVMRDALVAEGVRDAHLDAKTGVADVITALKGAIVAGFPADARKVMTADVKSLTEAQKVLRKTWQQRIGANFAKVRKHVRSFEAKAPAKPKTWCQTTRAMIDAIIKRAQAAEDVPADVVALVKHLQAAQKCVPASK